MRSRPRRTRKSLALVLAGLGLAGLGLGSAAQLDLDDSGTLGAGTVAVAACQTEPIEVSFTPVLAGDKYVVRTVTLDGIENGCYSKPFKLSVTGSGAPLATNSIESSIASSDRMDVTLSADVPASDVTGVALVITG